MAEEEEERRSGDSLLPKDGAHTMRQLGLDPKSFRSCLSWVCFDQSTMPRALVSWSIFVLLAIGVPVLSHTLLLCDDCDFEHQRPYDAVVQLSLSVYAAISFINLSKWSRKYGVRKFLFLDKLCDVSEKVRREYEAELQKSTKLVSMFVIPLFVVEGVYRIWWYTTGASEIPHLGNMIISHTIACTLQLCSWLYRTWLFILVSIFYQLTCHLQILRLRDFADCFLRETEVRSILREPLRIRRNLRIVSHRFRGFILWSLLVVTASQFMALLMTTSVRISVNLYEVGELTLCSISLVTGLFICLRSATKITHRAHSITSLAGKWHVCATTDSEGIDAETPRTSVDPTAGLPVITVSSGSEEDDEEDELDNTRIIPVYARTISFQKRQALVTYLENNRAGITVYGFMVDRTWLRTIFGVELALLLWLLRKTIIL